MDSNDLKEAICVLAFVSAVMFTVTFSVVAAFKMAAWLI